MVELNTSHPGFYHVYQGLYEPSGVFFILIERPQQKSSSPRFFVADELGSTRGSFILSGTGSRIGVVLGMQSGMNFPYRREW